MDQLMPIHATGYRTGRAALIGTETIGLRVADRPRINRRPQRSVVYDERARAGDGTGSSGAVSATGGTYQTGLFGEEAVADMLKRDGWRILGHRVRTKIGEIDLIARRGDIVAFVEVKTAGPRRIGVEHAVDARSRHRIRRAAVGWMAAHPALQRGVCRYRFDVFLVHRDAHGGITRVDHIQDAF